MKYTHPLLESVCLLGHPFIHSFILSFINLDSTCKPMQNIPYFVLLNKNQQVRLEKTKQKVCSTWVNVPSMSLTQFLTAFRNSFFFISLAFASSPFPFLPLPEVWLHSPFPLWPCSRVASGDRIRTAEAHIQSFFIGLQANIRFRFLLQIRPQPHHS